MIWRERGGLRWLEDDLGGATAAFSTRVGGLSRAPFESLNLGILTDDRRSVVGNRLRLAAALGLDPDRVAMARQVHGAEIAHHGPEPAPHFATPGPEPEHVDGHVTAEAGLGLLVLVADCLPIALRGPGGVAMLHCGWRGLAAGILEKGVEAVSAESASIGPGIGPCCFEIGPEVLAGFEGLGPGIARGRMLDLPEVARRKLAAAGVRRVEAAGICTRCEEDLFFSHRRDAGRTGRQCGIAWLG